MIDIKPVTTPEQIKAVQDLFREYIIWVNTFVDSGSAPTFEGFEAELAGLPGVFAPPTGQLWLATEDGAPAGCIALKEVEEGVGELKRLYVRPTFRGHGLGNNLVEALLEEAQALGYGKVILDSHITMKAAHTTYQSHGFKFVEAPADFPEELKPIVVFMECDLKG